MLVEPSSTSVRDRALLLGSMRDLQSVSDDALLVLADASKVRRFTKGRRIAKAAKPLSSAYLVYDGSARVERDGRVLETVDRFGSIGLISLYARETLGVDVIALSHCLLLEVPGEAVRIALQRDFSLIHNALRSLARRLLEKQHNLPRYNGPLDIGEWRTPELSMVERLLALRELAFAKYVNLDALAEMASSMREVRFSAGEALWRRGDPADHWVQITCGHVSCDTGSSTLEVGGGCVLGMLDSTGDLPRAYTARAESQVIGYRIDMVDLLAIMEIHLPLATNIAATFARGLLE